MAALCDAICSEYGAYTWEHVLWELPLAVALLMVAAIRERKGGDASIPTMAELEIADNLRSFLEDAHHEHAT